MTGRVIKFNEAINDALHTAMSKDEKVIYYGLGIDDPKQIFQTSLGLRERFGAERVFDTPASENGMTGIAVGASLLGVRPVMVHQRVDFFLLAMDQIVNSAAKWHFMFGGQDSVPVTIRLIMGRGWGQGPTHSQSLHSWFAHVPGLKVVMPATPEDAKGMLLSSIFDDNPVLFFEHRWLHEQLGHVPEGDFRTPLDKAKVVHEGEDITIVALSYMVIESLKLIPEFHANGINPEVIDLRSIQPIDYETIFKSVRKTKRLLILDVGAGICSVASELAAKVTHECFEDLERPPEMVTLPDIPVPTSFGLTDGFYPDSDSIMEAVGKVLQRKDLRWKRRDYSQIPHDIPGNWFRGPF